MDRRSFLTTPALALAARLCGQEGGAAGRMGVVIHSFGIRRAAQPGGPLHTALGFLEYCRTLGAGGVQTSIGTPDRAEITRIVSFLERHGMYLEGTIRLPQTTAEVDRFEAEVRAARACGATLLRTALLGGRRYETFRT